MSVIDLLFVKNKDSILTAGVGEPCLDMHVRYHCPIFGVFNFLKPNYIHLKVKFGSVIMVTIVSLGEVYLKLTGIVYVMMIKINTRKIFQIS